MLLALFANAFFEILLAVLVFLILIAVGSFYVLRDLFSDVKKTNKIRGRFHIEIRKIVNLIYNVHQPEKLESFSKVVIKKLPHEEKKNLLKIVDEVYNSLENLDADENKYIVETYENLQKIRRERDACLLVYNQKLTIFPYSFYARILKLKPYGIYTEKY